MKKLILTFVLLIFTQNAFAKKAPADGTIQRLIDSKKIYVGMGANEMFNLLPGFHLVDAGFGGEGGWAHNTRFFKNYAFVGWADYNIWDGGRGYYKIFIFEKKVSKKKGGCGRACSNGFKAYKGTATQLQFTNENKLIAIKDDFKSATEFLLNKEPLANLFLNQILEYEGKWGKIFGKDNVSIASRAKPKNKEITQKPKKEPKQKGEPKTSPDDNKIVPAGSGSGFFVSSNGTVITNHHVIEGCKLNKVSHKGSQYEAKVLAVDKVNDIAILKTNITPDRVFPVSNEDVSLLEDVVVAGYPLGKQVSSAIKTHKGVVTALAGAGDNYSNFQTDASINQGNSGGPILDQKGNVVGIAVATWVEEGVQGVHFGIKSSTLKTFANANGLKFLPANNRDLSNKDLGKLIMQSTVYVECHMTIASIKKMIAEAENKKAFFKEFE